MSLYKKKVSVKHFLIRFENTELIRKGFMRKKTREEAIKEFMEIHGDKYSYEKFEYVNARTKSIVTCKKHGDFLKTPDEHRRTGCNKCGDESSAEKRLKTFEEWVEQANKVHNSKYTYKAMYRENGSVFLSASCEQHGDFETRANNHIRGHACPDCGHIKKGLSKRVSLSDWIEVCRTVHDNFYSYEHCLEYSGKQCYMKVCCPTHGIFEIRAEYHKAGRGCSSCAQHGYDRLSPSHLYILQDKDVTKIGITNKLPSQGRVRDINRKSEKNFSIYHTFYHENGGKVLEIEQAALKYFKTLYPQPINYFHGARECFIDLDPELARQHIEKLFKDLQQQSTKECRATTPLETA